MESADIHRAKLRLLIVRAIGELMRWRRTLSAGNTIRYRAEVDNAHSVVETFARLSLDDRQCSVAQNSRDARDKARGSTEVVNRQFRADMNMGGCQCSVFRLQPREGITILLQAKQPGIPQ